MLLTVLLVATLAVSPQRPVPPEFLVRLGAHVAAGNCDRHPTGASYVRTTRQASEALFGDRVDSNPPVYLVALRGTFVAVHAHGIYGPGHPFPRGSVITFTVDAKTHDILDFGIGRDAPDLRRLGKTHDFSAALRAAHKPAKPPLCRR